MLGPALEPSTYTRVYVTQVSTANLSNKSLLDQYVFEVFKFTLQLPRVFILAYVALVVLSSVFLLASVALVVNFDLKSVFCPCKGL